MSITVKILLKTMFLSAVSIIAAVFILNYCLFYIELKNSGQYKDLFEIMKQYAAFLTRSISEEDTYLSLIAADDFRPVENSSSGLKPVLIFGCSFAYGAGLEDSETFSHKLAEYTNRPVYNRAKNGWGVQSMLYQLNNDDFYKMVPKPEYIIYVYIAGHLARIDTPASLAFDNSYDVFYNKTEKGFKLKKRTFFNDKIIIKHFFKRRKYWDLIDNRTNPAEIQKLEKETAEYLSAAKESAEKHWGGGIKFAVILYQDMLYAAKELSDKGFVIIDNNDFKENVNQLKYQISEADSHPNAAAWDVIVPVAAAKLGL